jgi:hypothetical protein
MRFAVSMVGIEVRQLIERQCFFLEQQFCALFQLLAVRFQDVCRSLRPPFADEVFARPLSMTAALALDNRRSGAYINAYSVFSAGC